MKAKVHFYVKVMKTSLQELAAAPVSFGYSLHQRIGPRWAFHSKYFPTQHFTLSSRLAVADKVFVQRLSSPLLDAECILHSMTRMQLFRECGATWKKESGNQTAHMHDNE